MRNKNAKLRVLMRNEKDLLEKRGDTLAEMARELGIPPTTIYSWFSAQRKIAQKHQKQVSTYLYPEDQEEQSSFLSRLRETIGSEASRVDPLAELSQGIRSIRIGAVSYPEFNGQHPSSISKGGQELETWGFFDRVFERFASYSDLTNERTPPSVYSIPLQEAEQALIDGEVDVVTGLFATPSRSLSLRFVRTPLTMPLQAVGFSKDMTESSGTVKRPIVEALTFPSSNPAILPIVNPFEIGGRYSRSVLRIPTALSQTLLVDYDVNSYLDGLLKNTNSIKTPLVIADELACVNIKKLLDKEAARSGNHLLEGQLAFPPGSIPGKTSVLPTYRICFAVNRQFSDWADFVEESFHDFLESHAYQVGADLWRTYRNVESLVSSEAEIDRWFPVSDANFGDQWRGAIETFTAMLQKSNESSIENTES